MNIIISKVGKRNSENKSVKKVSQEIDKKKKGDEKKSAKREMRMNDVVDIFENYETISEVLK
jgi:hypothetical protein